MIKLSYDLHIHSCLSPCGDEDMLPSNIIGMSALKNLDVIAVTDHNSCKNSPAVLKLAKLYDVIAIPGMEICTQEEVHVLCLFSDLDNALSFDEFVHTKLPNIKNNPEIFGHQYVCDENDNIIIEENILLINSVNISFDNLHKIVAKYDGVIIPAHIDKSSNSLLSNLGFIPPNSSFKCAEIKHISSKNKLLKKHSYLNNCNIITNSDAHYLQDINEPVNFIECEEKSIKSILNALSKFNPH